MAIPELKDAKDRLTDCIYFGDPLSASVGSGFVTNARTISTTAPLQGGGDLSANRTLTIDEFAGSTPGSVPTSPGGTARFLRADGTWEIVYPLQDIDYGDITVSGGGTTMAINAGAVSTTELGGDITAAGKDLLNDANVTAQRATLGLGTAAVLDAPASGDAAVGEVVKGDDTRLTDARTPAAHTHPQSEVTSLVADLAQKITTDGTARTIVQKAGATVGTRRGINLIEGTGVSLTVTDTAASERVDVTIASTSGVADGDKGDVTVSGSGATWTIDNGVVTLAKIANAAANSKLVGSGSAGSGAAYSEISLGTNITMSGTTLNVSSGTATLGDGDYGDVTVGSSGTEIRIDPGAVSLSKMADLSGPNKVIGRKTAGAGAPEELTIGSDIQAYDAELAAIAGLTSAADKAPYFTGSGTAALATLTTFGRSLIDDTDAATAQATLGLVVGTNVQAHDAELDALATTTSAADKVPYYTGAGTASTMTVTSFARTVLDDTTATAARTTLGAMGLYLSDLGGHVFDVKSYGAIGSGAVDDTTAIGSAIAAAAAISPRGIVFFPPGTYKTTGAFDLDGLDGLKIIGSGQGSTIIDINHATNDLFSVGATFTSNLLVQGFTFTSVTATRTAGWVFRVNNAYNGTGSVITSMFRDIEITKQFNGIGLQKFSFCWVQNLFGHQWAGGGVGLQIGQASTGGVNQGAGGGIDMVEIYGSDGVRGAGNPILLQPLVVEDCEGIAISNCAFGAGLTNSAKFATNDSTVSNHLLSNLFITNCSFDLTKNGHSVHITGAGDIARLKFNNCWFVSAGRGTGGSATANGLRIDCRIAYSSEFTGCNFYLTQGTGAYIATASGPADLIISGCRFYQNGLTDTAANADGLYVATSAAGEAPIITGCRQQSVGAVNGKGIRTGANTNRLMITGCRFSDGSTFGVAPYSNVGNMYT